MKFEEVENESALHRALIMGKDASHAFKKVEDLFDLLNTIFKGNYPVDMKDMIAKKIQRSGRAAEIDQLATKLVALLET
jgi:hypothetical protein